MRTKKPISKNNIASIRTAKGMSMEALATRIGTDPSTINKLEKLKMHLSAERLKLIADALDVDQSAILDGSELNIPTSSLTAKMTKPESRYVSMMPVMGSAAGSLIRGTFEVTDGPVDFITKPKALENARGVYALYIDGTSMEPMFRHGSICVVSEFKPPRIGDAVIIYEKKSESAPTEASIGILESRKTEKISIRKLNPSALIEIDARNINAMHKVLDYSEILGV